MNKRLGTLGSLTLFALFALLILCTACEGGTSGSVTGARERCSHRGRSGQCSGSFKTLSGTYSVDLENENASGPVQVEVQAAVDRGALKVWVESPGEEQTSVQVSPGEPVTLRGTAEGDWDGFTVYLQAVEGKAEGVSYEIVYQIP